ncbi:hypothetical protein FOZ63_000766 [Perkinsus olseni]|uniref:Uncharacterized protein n=1 Tax=Perkinsus olseni TaxID=32597 RepID=A0A7J6RPJ2_PEROL|nr:hypothetical protein FOZ60_010225 [Perkinsus olseni]KAF4722507.1 hypothetical protein FOZ63_000766 [Perkinsus olseni]KAF4737998.1 hypothetical protein FOZ62_000544 [Perkinsus olseni]
MRCSKTWLPEAPKNGADAPAQDKGSPESADIDDSALELPQDLYISMMTLGKEARARATHVPHQYRDILFIPRVATPVYPRIESKASIASSGWTTTSQSSPTESK